ncbi:MAG: TOBE domain-containing protein, partial [Pseudomonadota bacterium]
GGGPFAAASTGRKPIKLGARPEHIEVVAPGEGHCTGAVEVSEYLGADVMLYVNCGELGILTVRHVGDIHLDPGERVGLRFDEARTHFFDDRDDAILVSPSHH